MVDVCYVFRLRVKLLDGRTVEEEHKVVEISNKLGSAMATGRVVRYYEGLKAQKKIKDYQIIAK
jgi:hypothetical protein